MLSVQKTKAIDDIIKFIEHQTILISWKLDGLTLVLYYEGGCLKRALTRGEEGRIGEDVTHCVRLMENVPLEIPDTHSFAVRGEGILSWANFEKINSTLEDPYTSQRNLAAGSIRRLDAEMNRGYHLEFFAFDLIDGSRDYLTKTAKFKTLKENGFDVVWHTAILDIFSKEQMAEIIKSMSPERYPYPVDGLIFEYDNLAYGEAKGATGHHRNNMIALKWEDALYDSEFLGLEAATTRTGMISLTGKFKDTVIDGSFEKFEEAIKSGFDFSTLEDFGEIKNNNIYAWYQDKQEEQLWRPLLQHITFKEKKEEHVMKDNVFMGKTIVATGKLTNYTREGIKERLMDLGAKPGSSVSRKTDFLIVGEKPGSKVEKAGDYGVRIIDEDEFERLASA